LTQSKARPGLDPSSRTSGKNLQAGSPLGRTRAELPSCGALRGLSDLNGKPSTERHVPHPLGCAQRPFPRHRLETPSSSWRRRPRTHLRDHGACRRPGASRGRLRRWRRDGRCRYPSGDSEVVSRCS
jgi:hypothetical protein